MSVESASSIQKVPFDDSIIAFQQDAADFFDSIDPTETCCALLQISLPDGAIGMMALANRLAREC